MFSRLSVLATALLLLQPAAAASAEHPGRAGFARVRRASSSTAAARSALQPNGDAFFSVSAATAANATTCPYGLGNQAGGVVLLVHGTSSSGAESWGVGPYVQILKDGFDPCWVDLPSRAMGDAQLSAEYVARAILALAPQSKTGKVSAIGHSQGGGLNVQWALQFWPSTQPLVQNYIALAGDFGGTAVIADLCASATGCAPSVHQQAPGSAYLAAQAKHALVPTTSIYTIQDEVIKPETGANITSYLAGATVVAVQDEALCGAAHAANHVGMLTDPGAFALAKLTLETGAPVPINATTPAIPPAACSAYTGYPLLYTTQAVSFTGGTGLDVLTLVTAQTQAQAAEPPLQPYVCARGFATECGTAFPPS